MTFHKFQIIVNALIKFIRLIAKCGVLKNILKTSKNARKTKLMRDF